MDTHKHARTHVHTYTHVTRRCGSMNILVYCQNTKQVMFFKQCQMQEIHLLPGMGAWNFGLKNWNYTNRKLSEHSLSKWHRNVIIHARMIEQGEKQSVPKFQQYVDKGSSPAEGQHANQTNAK